MEWLLAFILAFAPGAALLWYIRHIDKYEPEPWHNIGWSFLAGCLSVIPAILIEMVLGAIGPASGFIGSVWTAFIVASMTEELCKGALGYAFIWRRPDFNEVMDGMVYFGVAHMGFAITENLKYIFLNSDGNKFQALMTGFIRTTTAVPLHVLAGMIMGYHLGVAKFARTEQERKSHWIQAFLWPILLHGFYDLAAFEGKTDIIDTTTLIRSAFGTALLYAAVVALWLFLLPRVRAAQNASPWKPQEWPSLPVAPSACYNCGSAYPNGANYCHVCAAPMAQQQPYYQEAPGAQ